MDRISELRSKFDFDSKGRKQKLTEASNFCQTLSLGEEKRRQIIENKATSIIGTAGFSATIFTAFNSLLISSNEFLSGWSLIIFLFIWLLTYFFIIGSIVVAIRSLNVAQFPIMEPNPYDILELKTKTIDEIKLENIASSFHSYEENFGRNNEKAGMVFYAQKMFQFGMICLFATSLWLALIKIDKILDKTDARVDADKILQNKNEINVIIENDSILVSHKDSTLDSTK